MAHGIVPGALVQLQNIAAVYVLDGLVIESVIGFLIVVAVGVC